MMLFLACIGYFTCFSTCANSKSWTSRSRLSSWASFCSKPSWNFFFLKSNFARLEKTMFLIPYCVLVNQSTMRAFKSNPASSNWQSLKSWTKQQLIFQAGHKFYIGTNLPNRKKMMT